jgi:1-deoxy-D-xylulose-5-phosphate reductoisomerase
VRAAAEAGGNRGTVLNAADEVAVAAFLAGALPFPDIATTLERAVDRWGSAGDPSMEEIADLDAEVRVALSGELGLRAGQ